MASSPELRVSEEAFDQARDLVERFDLNFDSSALVVKEIARALLGVSLVQQTADAGDVPRRV